jgi:GMC oxidoreductase
MTAGRGPQGRRSPRRTNWRATVCAAKPWTAPCGRLIFGRLGATEIQHRHVAEGAGHLRSHDHPNLFILGSTVFPTSATANPTLTIAALSRHAADQVKATLTQ